MGFKKTDKCIEKAFDDERLFVLMARDEYAPFAIIEWIKHSLHKQPLKQLIEALETAHQMANYDGPAIRNRIFEDKMLKQREAELRKAAADPNELKPWTHGAKEKLEALEREKAQAAVNAAYEQANYPAPDNWPRSKFLGRTDVEIGKFNFSDPNYAFDLQTLTLDGLKRRKEHVELWLKRNEEGADDDDPMMIIAADMALQKRYKQEIQRIDDEIQFRKDAIK